MHLVNNGLRVVLLFLFSIHCSCNYQEQTNRLELLPLKTPRSLLLSSISGNDFEFSINNNTKRNVKMVLTSSMNVIITEPRSPIVVTSGNRVFIKGRLTKGEAGEITLKTDHQDAPRFVIELVHDLLSSGTESE